MRLSSAITKRQHVYISAFENCFMASCKEKVPIKTLSV